jgi:hypothetical protein
LVSRREFFQAGLALSLLPAATLARESAESSSDEARELYKFIYDERFAPSVDFAREMERRGAETVATRGDITHFWYNDLDLRWKQGPVAIGGVTAHGPMFCMETLAQDRGMRLVHREELPVAAGDEPLYSWIIAPKQNVSHAGGI